MHLFVHKYLQVSYSTLKFHVSFPLLPFTHNYLKEAKEVQKDSFLLCLWPGLANVQVEALEKTQPTGNQYLL